MFGGPVISALRQQTQLSSIRPLTQPVDNQELQTAPQDGFQTSSQEPTVAKPDFSPAAEKPARRADIPMWMKATTMGLAGLVGIMSLTGCTDQPPTNQVETQTQREAREALAQKLSEIEKQMPQIQGGSGQQQAEQVTRQIMDAAKQYARESGKDGPGLVNDLRNLLQDHPALTITSIFALGTAGGVGLEKLGLSDGISQGVGKIYQAAKERPLLATGIALAVAGGTAYAIHQVATAEGTVPAKPTGAQAETLESTFRSLEEQISANPDLDAKEVNRQVMSAIQKYQQESSKPWERVADDVKAFAYEHPVLAATVIASAGVATGVVLERAGVPEHVANLAGQAFQGSKSAAANVGEFIKEHPVVSGAVAVGIAAGVGYLAYNHFGGGGGN